MLLIPPLSSIHTIRTVLYFQQKKYCVPLNTMLFLAEWATVTKVEQECSVYYFDNTKQDTSNRYRNCGWRLNLE